MLSKSHTTATEETHNSVTRVTEYLSDIKAKSLGLSEFSSKGDSIYKVCLYNMHDNSINIIYIYVSKLPKI